MSIFGYGNGRLLRTGWLSPTYTQNDKVEEPIDGCALEFGLARVLHELRVATGENDDAVAPAGVAEDAAAQQDLVVIQRILLAVPRQSAFELVEVVVGRLANDESVEAADPAFVLAHFGRFNQALTAFQIGLPVAQNGAVQFPFRRIHRRQLTRPALLSRCNTDRWVLMSSRSGDRRR
jgi:hypothetical protein